MVREHLPMLENAPVVMKSDKHRILNNNRIAKSKKLTTKYIATNAAPVKSLVRSKEKRMLSPK